VFIYNVRHYEDKAYEEREKPKMTTAGTERELAVLLMQLREEILSVWLEAELVRVILAQ